MLAILLPGCSDEPLRNGDVDGGTSLNVLVPFPEMAYANTRAENDSHSSTILAAEGEIFSLHLIGFYEDEEGKHHFYEDLTDKPSSQVDGIYRSYKLTVKPGTYRLYTLANAPIEADVLLALKDQSTTSDELENKVQSIGYNYGTYLPSPDPAERKNVPNKDYRGLPMAGETSVAVGNGESKDVALNLGFVCAKVRATVIYNGNFGADRKAKVSSLDVQNVYPTTKIFVAEAQTGNQTLKKYGGAYNDNNRNGGWFHEMTDAHKKMSLADWVKMPTDLDQDPLNDFLFGTEGEIASSTVLGGMTSFAYQNIYYMPEVVNRSGDTQCYLSLNMQVQGRNLPAKTINIGCSSDNDSHQSNTPGNIKRGNFYDVVIFVNDNGDVEYTYNVKGWEVDQMAIQLAGISSLYLSKTRITKAQDGVLSGENPVQMEYDTDAPTLSFDYDEVQFPGMDAPLPLFEVDQDPATKTLTVNINPDLPIVSAAAAGDALKNKGFWVVSGAIRKRVDVEEASLAAYLRLLPASNIVSVQNIANMASASVDYEFATNAEGLTLTFGSITNTNSIKKYEEGDPGQGVYIQVLDAEKNAISGKLPITTAITLNNKLNSGVTLPNDGFIRVTIADPTNASFYSKEIKAKFTASVTTSGVAARTADLQIEPNPLVYTIHFKAINGTTWDNPHIYVYQPLTFRGYPVFGWTGSNNINWLEYSFTGNRAFKGWKNDNGDINDLTGSVTTLSFGGVDVRGYSVGTTWGNPGEASPDTYYKTVQLVDNTKSSCWNCRTYGAYHLWPGVGMINEDDEYPGWWKIDLPLLAKPGLALIMFADDHDDPHSARYPADNDPGIALPNYSDREAWYLYDQKRGGVNCAFSDDRRESYPALPTMVYFVGGHNGWNGTGVTPDADGICRWNNEAIGTNKFKIKIVKDGKDDWRSNGTALNAGGTYTISGNNNTEMTMAGANGNSVYNVVWNNKTNQLTVTKAN